MGILLSSNTVQTENTALAKYLVIKNDSECLPCLPHLKKPLSFFMPLN